MREATVMKRVEGIIKSTQQKYSYHDDLCAFVVEMDMRGDIPVVPIGIGVIEPYVSVNTYKTKVSQSKTALPTLARGMSRNLNE